jgi:hypothetical protein
MRLPRALILDGLMVASAAGPTGLRRGLRANRFGKGEKGRDVMRRATIRMG